MKQNKQQQELLEKIKDTFEHCEDYYSKDYKRNKEDTKFVLGDQWDEKDKEQRKKFKQPCLTENRLLPFALKTVNEIRKARPAISVKPVDDKGDVETAEIYSGLIRNIQYASGAENDYDTSAYNAIVSARGFLKIETQYESYDSFNQEIAINCVEDPFKGYLDPASKEIDGSDATFFIEFVDMPKDQFKREFPKHKYEDVDKSGDNWFGEDYVRVVDYWYKEYETKTLYRYYDTDTREVVNGFDKPEDDNDIIDERTTEVCSIKHCRSTGLEILSQSDIIGKYLPIVPVYGLVAYKDGKREVYSLIHQAKDPQRMFNFWKSSSAEVVGIQSKTPWVGYKGSFANNAQEWARSNIENIPFLEAEPVVLENGAVAPLPQRQPAPQGSAIMTKESMMAADGIKAALGIYDPSIGQQSNEISGIAIERRQLQGDNATYHFVDNLVSSMRQVGKVVVDMIPEIYSDERVLRILGEDGESNLVGVNQPVVKDGADYLPANGEYEGEPLEYNLEIGKYDVIVEVGSNYATRRQETNALLKELMASMPVVGEVAPDLIIKSSDVQYSDEIAKRVRAVMDPALLGDDAEAERVKQLSQLTQELQGQLEQANIALQVKEENAQFDNEVKARELAIKEQEVQNDTIETIAKVNKLEAEANVAIPAEAMNDVSSSIERLQGQVKDISDTVGLFLDNEEKKRSDREPIEINKGK